MRTRVLLSIAASVLMLWGCDSASLVSTTPDVSTSRDGRDLTLLSLDIPVDGAEEGDFVYRLGRLPDGGQFRASLDFADGGGVDVVGVGSPGGVKLGLSTLNGISPESVTVAYLADGDPVGPEVDYAYKGQTLQVGLASREPDSYHYDIIDGEVIVTVDYKRTAQVAFGDVGATIETAWGERADVTDIVFTLAGVDAGPPQDVRLTAPVDLDLQWFDLER